MGGFCVPNTMLVPSLWIPNRGNTQRLQDHGSHLTLLRKPGPGLGNLSSIPHCVLEQCITYSQSTRVPAITLVSEKKLITLTVCPDTALKLKLQIPQPTRNTVTAFIIHRCHSCNIFQVMCLLNVLVAPE